MKRLFLFSLLAPLIVACTQPAEEAPAAPETEVAAAPEPAAYYEFLWCNFGENYSIENRDAYFAEFNEIVDSMSAGVLGSFGYRPRDWESENFDALWVTRWPDKAASEAGWAEWREIGGNETLQAKHPGVLMCGQEAGTNVFGFTTYIPKEIPATFSVENPPYHVDNSFCTFNEGKGPEDMRSFLRDHYRPFLDRYTADNPDNSYWFAIGVPDFEPAQPTDFNWINYWTSAEEAAAGFEAWETDEAGLPALMGEVATCSDNALWDAMPIRVPPNPA